MFQISKLKFWANGIAAACSSIAFAAILGIASNSSAAVLLPGGSVTPTALGTLPAGDTILVVGGNPVTETNAFTGTDAFGNVKFTGTLTSSVYSDPGTGGLDFLYQATNDASSVDAFDEVSLKSFSGFNTDVDYVTGTGATNPNQATRSSDTPGKNVAFFFNSGVPQASNTSDLLIETNSANYMTGVGSVIDGGAGGTTIEAPAVGTLMTVPEPASFSAIVIVGGILLGRRRR
jgi:hypothetical protein